nr:hypothetical protein HEP84_05360 [Streptomyces sp. RLB1-33]
MSFATLRERLLPSVAAAPSRPDFHQLTLVTRGEGTALIDFVDYPCAPGTLLHLRPGQVQRFPADPQGALRISMRPWWCSRLPSRRRCLPVQPSSTRGSVLPLSHCLRWSTGPCRWRWLR